MTIEDIKKNKTVMEASILTAVQLFEKTAGCSVSSVNLSKNGVGNPTPTAAVQTQISITW